MSSRSSGSLCCPSGERRCSSMMAGVTSIFRKSRCLLSNLRRQSSSLSCVCAVMSMASFLRTSDELLGFDLQPMILVVHHVGQGARLYEGVHNVGQKTRNE